MTDMEQFADENLTNELHPKEVANLEDQLSLVDKSLQSVPTMSVSDATNFFYKLCQDLQSSDQVRVGVKEDGKLFVAVYDFINFVTDKDQFNHYAGVTWKRLTSTKSPHADELDMLTFSQKFATKNIPCMNLAGIFLHLFSPIFIHHNFIQHFLDKRYKFLIISIPPKWGLQNLLNII